jgi:hypothetical protein
MSLKRRVYPDCVIYEETDIDKELRKLDSLIGKLVEKGMVKKEEVATL